MNGLQEALHNAEQVRPHCVRGDGVDDWLAWWWMWGAWAIGARWVVAVYFGVLTAVAASWMRAATAAGCDT